jgi:glutamine synthetase
MIRVPAADWIEIRAVDGLASLYLAPAALLAADSPSMVSPIVSCTNRMSALRAAWAVACACSSCFL